MNLDEAKELWSSENESTTQSMSTHALSESDILQGVKEKSDAFDKRIWRRDLIESIAALVVFLFFAWILRDPSWVVRTGALMVMGGSAFIYWKLRRTRTQYDTPSMDRPVAEVIRTERAKVDVQIRLLERILEWYIAPLAIGVILVVAGDEGLSWFTVGYAAFVALISAGIYYLNQRAVRCSLRPRHKELTRLLQQVEEE